MAAGIPDHRRARLSLAAALPLVLLSARDAPAHLGGRTRLHPRRPGRRGDVASAAPPGYGTLLRLPQTWGIVIGKALTDPVWFFITDWFAIYLVSRGFSLEHGLLAFWVPFVAADAGNFLGGGVSSYLIRARLLGRRRRGRS